VLDDAMRTFSENPASDLGVETINKALR
jgi:hypothetical protein